MSVCVCGGGDPQNLQTGPLPSENEVGDIKAALLPRVLFCSNRSVSTRESALQRCPLWEKPQASGASPELKQVWQLLPCLFCFLQLIAIAAFFINIDFGWLAWLPTRYFALISQMTCDAALSWYHPACPMALKPRVAPKSCIREVSFLFHLLASAFLLSQYLPFPFLSRPLFPFPPLPGLGKPVPL